MAFNSITGLAVVCLVFVSFNASAELTDNNIHSIDDNIGLVRLDLSETFTNTRNATYGGGIYDDYLADTSTILDSGSNTMNKVTISNNESAHLTSTAPSQVQDIPAPFIILLLGLGLLGLHGLARRINNS